MKKAKFKMTEIGLIPKDWEVKRLGDCATITRGGSPRPIESYLTTQPDGLNWVKIGDVTVGAKYIEKTAERILPSGLSSTREVKSGDFLLSNSMSFGRPYIMKISGCIHDGWLVIQDYKNDFDQEFLYYVLGSDLVLKQYATYAAGSSVLNLNKDVVSRVVVMTPPLAEQKAIAEVLSDVDALIAAQEELIEKKRAIKEGTMQELLTGKKRLPGFGGKSLRSLHPLRDKKYPTENAEIAEFKQTELGEIPVDWEVKRLGDCGVLCNGYAFKSSSYKENGKYKVITIANVQDGAFFADTASAISDLPRDLQCHQILNKGDILVSMTGNVGRTCCVSEKDCLLNQRVGKFNSIKIDKSFFYAVVQDKKFIAAMVDKGQGGAQANISKFDIEEYLFPLPSLAEQKAIAEVLSDMDAEIESLEAKRAKYEGIKQGMMQELLTGKTRLV